MPQYLFENAIWQEEGDIEDKDFLKFLPNNKKMHSWIKDSRDITVNILHTETSESGNEAIWGSLIYRQNPKKKDDLEVFHFYLSKDILVTNELDFETDEDLDKDSVLRQMKETESTTELMMILLGDMISSILHKIDVFEEQLRNLLWEIRERNDKKTLDKIEVVRHEILLWQNLVMGFLEIRMAIFETFGKDVEKEKEYIRTSARIDRCIMLIRSYKDEINNMVDMENVVANYRGNEIMKTLTVLTTLFTPVMAFGALWGMNFEKMPELSWTYGYLGSLIVIVASTVFLYFYLKNRGWTGDILKTALSKSSKLKKQ
ncbi:magnesium transporter CorA family protein [Planococcus shenhongbingii]|uniref:Magnesium transporter CorA family protein n=1 Tax=Planococcus shenhongbingii TaxID=3058398 RepID=A0ABT8NG80_9BACL|nr:MULTISPECIES: magnesium transporter CorA family protein [unclassified Planococcus (in: firmicutes)]MDN7246682.1 magnesium transporter CorA family protein [Planococcus sp. N017]WKA58958.1 magnesium transporter CorA family protein [Planococcus sp. N016]